METTQQSALALEDWRGIVNNELEAICKRLDEIDGGNRMLDGGKDVDRATVQDCLELLLDSNSELKARIDGLEDAAGPDWAIALQGRQERVEKLLRKVETTLHGDRAAKQRWEELDKLNITPKDVPRPEDQGEGLLADVTRMTVAVSHVIEDHARMAENFGAVASKVDRMEGRLADWLVKTPATRQQMDEGLERLSRELHRRIGELGEKLKGIAEGDLHAAVRWALKYKAEVERKLEQPGRLASLIYAITGREVRA
jgi:hypothetical protein